MTRWGSPSPAPWIHASQQMPNLVQCRMMSAASYPSPAADQEFWCMQARASSLRRALEREYAATQARRSEPDRPSGSRPAISPAGRSGRERGSSSRDRESRERSEGRQERPEGGSRPSRPRQSAERSVLESRARRILEEIDSMGIQAALQEGESRRRRVPGFALNLQPTCSLDVEVPERCN